MREFQKISTRKKGDYEAAFREEKPNVFQRLTAIFGHTVIHKMRAFRRFRRREWDRPRMPWPAHHHTNEIRLVHYSWKT